MVKKEKEKIEEMISVSAEMVRNCKSAISQFGFGAGEYEQFLQSVKAMRSKDRTVIMYPISDMTKYRDEFIQKHEVSLADIFVFEKFFSKNSVDKEHFIPRSFWDFILKQYN